jgi:lipopolysaccharide/colanic/teichoic acid biosynthesis glycosyltransferase
MTRDREKEIEITYCKRNGGRLMQGLEINSEATPMENLCEYKKSLGYFITKRIIDIIGALCGILLLGPVMIVVAIWIKADSKGPIFFIQERVGQDGRGFMMYKFRAMCTDVISGTKTKPAEGSGASFEKWMKMDIKYLEERNIWIDIKLIFITAKVLFGDAGAK